jgi:exodeoxyribonuclease-3
MKFASWNVNGIRARHEALCAWIERNRPDIVVLQEVKASASEIPEDVAGIDGYLKFWNGSSFRKGYSGVAILLRAGACPDPSWEIPPFDVENRTAVLHCGALTLIGTYVPRGDGAEHYAVKLRYLEELRSYVAELLGRGREVVLTGDMNVAHRDIDVHRSQNKPGATGLRPEERAAIDAHLALGLRDVMRDLNPDRKDLFTWWPNWKMARERNLGWRIDCFYVSQAIASKVAAASVDPDERSSDHAPIVLELRGV